MTDRLLGHWPTTETRTTTTELIAHRGASFDAPENTLAAFDLAWQQGADGIETDVHLTADGHVVCIHDANTRRTTGMHLTIAHSWLGQLQQLDAGAWKADRFCGLRIPTFEQLLDTLPPDKRLVVEIKCGPEILEPLSRVVRRSAVKPEQLLLVSFRSGVVAACKQRFPQFKTHLAVAGLETNRGWQPTIDSLLATLRRCRVDGVDCDAERMVADPALSLMIRQAGLRLSAWTVNDPAVLQQLHRLGLRAFTTDRPGWLREYLRQSVHQ